MSKKKLNEIPVYQRHTNFKCLIDGYCRQNWGSQQYVASINGVILSFTDKMNGFTFRWHLNTENMSHKTLDSDTFDLELSNKFFLRATKDNSDMGTSTTINLISFPFPPKFGIVLIHCQFYCDETNEIQSKIHETNLDSNHPFQMDHVNWKIFHQKSITNLTIECKINILRIAASAPHSPYNYPRYAPYNVSNYDPHKAQNIIYNNNQSQVAAVHNAHKTHAGTLRFAWNIQQKQLISKIKTSNDIQIVSNVFHNIFQIVIWNNHSKRAYFGIRIVGLPQFTHKMGVQMAVTMNNKVMICCKTCTFSYDECLYRLPRDREDILSRQLLKKKQLKITCTANIIARYGRDNHYISTPDMKETIKQSPKKIFVATNKTKTEILTSKSKIVPCGSQSFIWNITNPVLLTKIRSKQLSNSMLNSPVFELFEHGWYVSIEHDSTYYNYSPSVSKQNKKIKIRVHCLGFGSNESMDCKILMRLLQTGVTAEFYQNFCTKVTYSDRQKRCLESDILSLSLLNQISIKITVFVVTYKTNHMQSFKQSKESENGLGEEVKSWLYNKVGLGEYCALFVYHGIDTLETVKLLSKADMRNMGIDKVGHQIKFASQIQLLLNGETANTNNRKRRYGEINDGDIDQQCDNSSPTKKAKNQ